MLIPCDHCATLFEKAKHEIERSAHHFCSRSCSCTFFNKIKPRRKVTGKCKNCQTPIPTRLTYCSGACKKACKKQLPNIYNNTFLTSERNGKKVSNWRRRTKLRAIEYKGGKCIECEYNRCHSALEFHHLDPTQKDFSFARNTVAWEKVKKELDKCVLLCSNCHREVHAGIRILNIEPTTPAVIEPATSC